MTQDGAVDTPQLIRLVEHLVTSGVHALVPAGGSGEFSAMSTSERTHVVEVTVEVAAGRVPVIAGVLSPGFGEAVQAGRDFLAAGANALMVLAPFYVTPSQTGIREYYKAFRDAVDLPVLAYDIPYRTGISVAAETIVSIYEDGSIIGMKESSLDIAHFNRLAAMLPKEFDLLSGEEALFPVHMALGAKGAVLATSALLPKYWVELYKLAAAGKVAECIAGQRRLLPFFNAVFAEANPGPLKAAMALAGMSTGPVRLPLREPVEATLVALKLAINELRDAGLLEAAL